MSLFSSSTTGILFLFKIACRSSGDQKRSRSLPEFGFEFFSAAAAVTEMILSNTSCSA
jgi:hypothetical protein